MASGAGTSTLQTGGAGRVAARGLLALVALAGTAAYASGATLDERCVVSVLNRTVPVKADGSWVLPNIPSNIGRVRARATCLENGLTRSGESEYFVVPRFGVVKVPEIRFDAVTTVPSRILVSAPLATLRGVGESVQLTTTATYPGGGRADVSASSRGTNYTASNAAVASVGEDGLVTAHASGVVIVTAINDGASGLLRVSVVLGGDSDGDSIPDDVELANGLNPNDPVDALADFDRDGLINREELRLGTGIRDADSDRDTLVDGREVAIGTDPSVFDTDGDGIGDGLEVGTGSDPLDPSSYSLAQALSSLEVSPSAARFIVNTLLGEVSRQLRVTGHLRDGRTIDLTSRTRGTGYASSDLSIVSFGGVDGQIFGGADGNAVVTVRNAGFSATVQVSVRTFSPRALSFVSIPGFANNVDVAGDHAYVAAGSAGLQVVDVRDRSQPRLEGALDTPGNANDVAVVGSVAFVADGPAGLAAIDVSDPASPRLLGSLALPGVTQDVVVRGSRAYLACGASGMAIVDVADPSRLVHLGGLVTADAKGVDVSGSLAVVADSNSLRVIDVSNSAAPVPRGTLEGLVGPRDVAVGGNIAYVADYTGSLKVVDVSTPTAPRLVATTDQSLGGVLTDVVQVRDFIFGADELFVNGVPIVDVSDPSAPQVRVRLDFPARDDDGTGIAADNSYIYLTAGRRGDGIRGDTRLYIGQYLQLADDAGVPPTLAITSPPDGSQHFAGATVTVRAQAADDVGVAVVTFGVDGVPVFTDAAEPFELSYTIPRDVSFVTFTATATDFGGNDGNAAPVTVSVVANPAPSVLLTSPLERNVHFEGQTVTLSATATDNARVRRIAFTVNGETLPPGLFDQPSASLSLPYTIPLGSTELFVIAVATDDLGQAASTTGTFEVRRDPRTLVVGRVIDELLRPVAGAVVTVFETSGQSAADGSFAIAGVSTVRGIVSAFASAIVGGVAVQGTSAAAFPVPGGTTNVGVIRLLVPLVPRDVGYYDLRGGGIEGIQDVPIVAAGLTPVALTTGIVGSRTHLATVNLDSFACLFIQNSDNLTYNPAYVAQLPRIFDWIASGGVLVFHDRKVEGADTVLPGAPGSIVREVSEDLRDNVDIVDDTTAVTNGPGGILTNSSLDGGSSSSHGYVAAATIPPGARGILSRANPDELVLYAYPFGRGWVVYSTMPLDAFLGRSDRAFFSKVYAPNVLTFAVALRQGR